jgi:ABC-type taurine transport system substrate-binding protein
VKCPYINPTINQCLNCTLDECGRSTTADNYIYIKRWQEKNPDKVKQYAKTKRDNYSTEKKQAELQRLAEWKQNHTERVKKSVKRCGKRWRKAHKQEERERNRTNYLKRKERQAG